MAPDDGDVLAATEARLRDDPTAAASLVAELAGALARAREPAAVGRHLLALATAHLAADQPREARDLLVDAAGQLPAGDAAAGVRCAVRLAAAEAALGDRRAARLRLSRLDLGGLLAQADPALEAEAAAALRAAGEGLAAGVLDAARRRRPAAPAAGGADRLGALGRLVAVLSSGAVGTAEPRYAVLRAILEVSGAERGFLMLYEGAALTFGLGLTDQGRLLGPEDFAYSTTIVERALAAGRCVLVEDVAREAPLSQASSARALGLRSAACVPLRVERKRVGAAPAVPLHTVRGVLGVLYVDAAAARCFGPDDAGFLEACACCAVLAVREARALQALQAARAAPAARADAAGPGRVHAPAPAALPPGAPGSRFPGLVTRDPALLELLDTAERAARSKASLLIRGESGSGKELIARGVHALGPRAAGPFVVVDCGAIPDELVGSELLGHERGAFTGASAARPGLFEQASGGTLFLDEVGDMSPALQGALLRALQEGEVRRVGGDVARAVDVRVVASTQHDVRALAERGELRQDLLYRLAAVELRVPPLRERPGDIPLLVDHLLAPAPGRRRVDIEELAVLRLLEHPWAGNVRELENVLVRARLLARGDVIRLADVDLALADAVAPAPGPPPAAPPPTGLPGTLEEVERALIAERLAQSRGNQVQAARSLGIDRNTLRRKMLRHGIPRA